MQATAHLFAGRKTLALSMAEVKRLLPMHECIRLQELAFADHARGGGINAPSTWLRVHKHQGWMKLLAGFVDETDAMGIKVLARYPNNPSGMNLGSLIVLFDATNGFPLAIFDGVYITAVRTGAGGWNRHRSLRAPRRESGRAAGHGGCRALQPARDLRAPT